MRVKTKVEQLERRVDAIAPDDEIVIICEWFDAVTGEKSEAWRTVIKAHRHFAFSPVDDMDLPDSV